MTFRDALSVLNVRDNLPITWWIVLKRSRRKLKFCCLFFVSRNFFVSASLILFADSLLLIQMDAFSPVGIGGMKNLNTRHLKLFVGNLAPSRTSRDLCRLFESYGVIRQAVVIPDRFRVRSRCYGFV